MRWVNIDPVFKYTRRWVRRELIADQRVLRVGEDGRQKLADSKQGVFSWGRWQELSFHSLLFIMQLNIMKQI
jgi:hypothetical protein